ncbi:MAG TPA: glycogen debranching protein GlgX [Terriglobia bacterium]|jgi:glycogen operon protein|nr:glycogen debranching protein GlgX [Terriglobia bacterium]
MPNDPTSSEPIVSRDTEEPPESATGRRNVPSAEELAELERLLSLCEVQSVRSGVPFPLGATFRANGVNFAIFSRHATGVRLDLFERPEDGMPTRSILLNPVRNKTGDVWHVWLEGIMPGQLYGYRFAGPYAPHEGHRFNPDKLVVDACATAIAPVPGRSFLTALGYDPSSPLRDLSYSTADNAATAPKSVVSHPDFDWQDDQPLRLPSESTVIYELHVRGFTIHPSAGVAAPGTYKGLTEKIPYLKDLGVTAVELMPVQEFNEYHMPRINPHTGKRLRNYWGYDPINFFAVKSSYASIREKGAQVLEFKEMVRTFHQAGIEVILDVVFNHTVEGNEMGPTVCFRGIDNAIYYWLAEDKRYYRDFSGTGQTINATHPVVRDMILDALRYWVIEMHVDGFRFDLASVLGRDRHGNILSDAPLLERIAEDPILRDAKLIAEAWDAAGAYQVGGFSYRRWAEWNGRYRDDVRKYWRGDDGMAPYFASRITGSYDLYHASGKGPECSINFVTCHDGFTLNDLVSYSQKHNEDNGEGNRDGMNENYSSNYGVEGETNDPAIEAVRCRQIKNMLLTLAISRGIPMLLAGDEFRRTQRGNNNAYCQDNEISWVDWTLLDRNRDIYQFARGMLAFRRTHPVLRREAYYTQEELRWFDPAGKDPNWFDPRLKALACLVRAEGGPELYFMFNPDSKAVRFAIPPARSGRWVLAVDTTRPTPRNFYTPGAETPLRNNQSYLATPRSAVVLVEG